MTLGEKIAALRAEHKMSQGDLAEKLNVSRQSVSKWETDASIPELDKMIALSELFEISLDALVKDTQPEEKTPEQTGETKASAQRETGSQKILGYIFLTVGLLCAVLGLLFSRILFALCLYLLVVGLICLTVHKHAFLVIGWVTLLPVIRLLPATTGVGILALFSPSFYQDGISAFGGTLICLVLLLVALICITVWVLWKKK